MAQIFNASGSPYINQIIVTGGSNIRGISSDQDSNVWVTHLDGTVHTITGVNSSVSTVQGITLLTGLANAYGFSGERSYPIS